MTTAYWMGSGTQTAPASGNWNVNEGTEWSGGSTPNGKHASALAVSFAAGTYTVTVDNDQRVKEGNTYRTYSSVYPYEVTYFEIQSGAIVSFESSSEDAPAGIQTDDALTNDGSVTFDIGGTGVTAGSAINTGTFTVGGGKVTDSGTFSNSDTVNLTAGGNGMLSIAGGLSNSGTINAGMGTTLTVAGQSNSKTPASGTINVSAGGTVQVLAGGSLYGQTITASGTGAIVLIGGTIGSSTLQSSGGGIIEAAGGTLDGSTSGPVVIAATLTISDLSSAANSLYLEGAIVNSSTIILAGSNADAELLTSGATTLVGGGTIILTDGDFNIVDAGGPRDTLTNVDNTISGNGTLGQGTLVLTNQGRIDATGGSPLVVGLASSTASANGGTMEASGGGDLDFVRGKLTNTGAIDAAANSTIEIAKGVALSNAADGIIEALGGSITIGGLGSNSESFSNAGTVIALDGGSVLVGQSATSSIAGGALLSGAWDAYNQSTLAFSDSFKSDAGTLFLDGSGVISDGGQTLQNSLTDVSGKLETLDTDYTTANALSLEGILQVEEGSFTSGLVTAAASSTIEGAGATIASALQTAGTVSVENQSLTFTGNDTFSGNLTGPGSLTFENDTATLMDGVSIGAGITLDDATLYVATSIANVLVDTNALVETGSTISFTSNQSLTLAGTTTLNGGEVTGTGGLSITGAATSSGFTVDTGAALAVSGGGTLAVQSGTFANNGTLGVSGTGSAVTFGGTAQVANNSGGTLTGGTFNIGLGATMTLTGGVVTVDAASISVGNGGVFQSGSGTKFTTLQKSLKAIAAGSSLVIAGGTYTFSYGITLNGTLEVLTPPTAGSSAAVFSSGFMTASAGSTIESGYQGGTIASSLADAGTVLANNPGNLIFTGATDKFSGAFQSHSNLSNIDFSAGTDTLAAGASFSDYSTVINGATVQLGASIVDNGNLSMSSGTLSLRGSAYTFTVNGTTNHASSFNGGTVLGPGTLALDTASAVFDLTISGNAKLSNAGTMTVSGAIVLNKGYVLNQTNGTIELADASFITLADGATGTLTNSGLIETVASTIIGTIGTALTNSGTILAANGTLEITKAIGGTGALDITGGTLQLDALPGSGQSVNFQSGGGTLALNAVGKLTPTISGFTYNDTFDLLTMSGATVTSFTEASNGTEGTLVIGNGTQTDTFTLLGSYTAGNFAAASDLANGTDITYQAAETGNAAQLNSGTAHTAATRPATTHLTPTWDSLFPAGPRSAVAPSSTFAHSGLAQALFDAASDHGWVDTHSAQAAQAHASIDLAATLDGMTKTGHA